MDEHAASTPDVNRLADHNVIAALADVTTAGEALDKLRSEGFSDGELSLLTRDQLDAEADSFEEPRNLGATMAGGTGPKTIPLYKAVWPQRPLLPPLGSTVRK